jgi:sigma-E factor negative regulatory protein RseA
MTERIQDQISAFVDDELSAEECSFFVRRLARDDETRSQLIRYATIGAALRGEVFHPDPEMFRRRLQGALDGAQPVEPVPSQQRSRPPRNVLKPLAGIVIAASVATAAIALSRLGNGNRPGNPGGLQAQSQLQELELDGLPSYVVPPDSAEQRFVSPELRLTNYLVRHGEYASGIGRTVVHSNVMIHTADDADAPADGDPQ